MVPIVVIAGQSNAVGRGTVPLIPAAYLTEGYDDPYPPVQLVYKTSDAPDDPPTWGFDEGPDDLDYIHSGNGTYGIELSLGRKLHRLGYEHAIAKMAITSSSLGTHWKVGATYPTLGDNLFTQFLAYCTAAQTSLSGTVTELIWIQGEADAGNLTNANAYAANFATFASTFRSTFPAVPITINRLHSASGGTYNSIVRAQQDIIAATVPGIRIFSVDDLDLTGAHFTSPAFLTLGERFADRIVRRRPRVGVGVGLGAA